MNLVPVLVIKPGYIDRVYKPGDRFRLNLDKYGNRPRKVNANGDPMRTKADGVPLYDMTAEPTLPSWVVEDTEENRQKLGDGARFDARRAREAAVAAAGPKRAKRGFAVAPEAEESVDEDYSLPEDLV